MSGLGWIAKTIISYTLVGLERLVFLVWSLIERSTILKILILPFIMAPIFIIAVIADYYGYSSEDLL
jgi:hypothetical protein